jgi:signal transduction histidine kinase
MGSPLERRRGPGRRRTDDRDTRALRGLLHDLGHEMTTLSYLVEAVRGDVCLADDSSYRLELLSLEMARLLEIIREGLAGPGTGSAGPVGVREVVTQLARLGQLAYPAEVSLLPGPEVTALVNPVLLWRVLANLVENAARAAGPDGRVTLAIRHESGHLGGQAGQPGEGAPASGPGPAGNPAGQAVIEVSDDGPGFGAGPPGAASIGLEVVSSLLESAGGTLVVESGPGRGTTARVTLPAGVAAPRGPGARLRG